MTSSRVAAEPVDELRAYAVEIGEDLRLVQGAGGNFSAKADDVMWIKASGKRLTQAFDEQIFLAMQLGATREAVLETEALLPFVLPDETSAGLRPSIETSLHALLPHRVVLHVHSTGAIAAGLRPDPRAAFQVLPEWFATAVIPYAKPGVGLARAVFAEIGNDVQTAPIALLLLNHGLVVAADDVQSARRIITAVQDCFAWRPAPPGPKIETADDEGWILLHPSGTLDEEEAAMLRLGAFTPDQAVFMGPVPFTARLDPDPRAPAAIGGDGSVWIRRESGADEREVAHSMVDVARLAHHAAPQPLAPEQVDELINWEAEEWRRRLRR